MGEESLNNKNGANPAGDESQAKPVDKNTPIENISFKNNRELLLFLFLTIRENKKWWLMPLFLVLAFLSLFVSLTGNASILPAIYALF